MSRRGFTEESHQRWLAEWLDAAGVLWCHVPLGGNRSAVTGAKLKAQGAKAGVPDVLIFTPPPRHPHAPGVALELKAPGGAKPRPEQQAWLEALAALGWIADWHRGFAPAVEWLESLGYGMGTRSRRAAGICGATGGSNA